MNVGPSKSQIKAARAKLEDYQSKKLIELQKVIRLAFDEFDKGKIDAFELDDVIHKYNKKAKDVLSFSYSISLHGSNDNLKKLLAIIDED